jgi:hypothetical protein
MHACGKTQTNARGRFLVVGLLLAAAAFSALSFTDSADANRGRGAVTMERARKLVLHFHNDLFDPQQTEERSNPYVDQRWSVSVLVKPNANEIHLGEAAVGGIFIDDDMKDDAFSVEGFVANPKGGLPTKIVVTFTPLFPRENVAEDREEFLTSIEGK